MAMIFGDYVAGFLGLGRDGCSWSMNPFDVSRHLFRGGRTLADLRCSPSRRPTVRRLLAETATTAPSSLTSSTAYVFLSHMHIQQPL